MVQVILQKPLEGAMVEAGIQPLGSPTHPGLPPALELVAAHSSGHQVSHQLVSNVPKVHKTLGSS